REVPGASEEPPWGRAVRGRECTAPVTVPPTAVGRRACIGRCPPVISRPYLSFGSTHEVWTGPARACGARAASARGAAPVDRERWRRGARRRAAPARHHEARARDRGASGR